MKILILLFSLLNLAAYGQKFPLVNFNHLYAVIDSADLRALQKSGFIKNKFAALVIRTTKADNAETWTGTYLEGLDNYLELFDVSVGDPLGNAGIGFSVDKIGEIYQLDSVLSKNFTTEKEQRVKQYDDRKIPWFTSLRIKDSVFDSFSHISFWVMEYKPEYFDYNHWKHEDNKLTRTTYLSQYEDQRRNKILKRFTGVTLHVTDKERQVISDFLINCGYHKLNKSSYSSPENFIIHFIDRNINDRYAMASIKFETNIPLTYNIKISENIEIRIKNSAGKIIFK